MWPAYDSADKLLSVKPAYLTRRLPKLFAVFGPATLPAHSLLPVIQHSKTLNFEKSTALKFDPNFQYFSKFFRFISTL